MSVNSDYLNAIADNGNPITHIGILDDTETELSSGSYARQPVTWTSAADGNIQPSADLEFDVADGDEAYFWQVYDDVSAGTGYGAVALDSPVVFSNPGTLTLQASSTGIDHNAAA